MRAKPPCHEALILIQIANLNHITVEISDSLLQNRHTCELKTCSPIARSTNQADCYWLLPKRRFERRAG